MSAESKPHKRRKNRMGIRDVAAAAGVSITTVSDALNGKGRIPEATREHVRLTADRLGYRPSVAARTLRTGRSGLLGLTTGLFTADGTSGPEVDSFVEIARAALAAAHDRGYSLVILPTTPQGALWRSVAVDGIVLFDGHPTESVAAELHHQDIPIVAADGARPASAPVHGWVTHDEVAATERILNHFAERGARHVGLLRAAGRSAISDGDLTAYQAWCVRRGQAPIVEEFDDPADAPRAADRILARTHRPDAVLGTHHTCARALLAAAQRRRLIIPCELMVACLSENPALASSEPPVTTVGLHPRASAAAAVDILVDVIEARTDGHPVLHPHARTLPAELRIRESTLRGAGTPG